jgi:hypothetical protein
MPTLCFGQRLPIEYRYNPEYNKLSLKFNRENESLVATHLENDMYYLNYSGTFGDGYSIFKTINIVDTRGGFNINDNNVIFHKCVKNLNDVNGGKPKRQRKSRRKSRKSKQTRRK